MWDDSYDSFPSPDSSDKKKTGGVASLKDLPDPISRKNSMGAKKSSMDIDMLFSESGSASESNSPISKRSEKQEKRNYSYPFEDAPKKDDYLSNFAAESGDLEDSILGELLGGPKKSSTGGRRNTDKKSPGKLDPLNTDIPISKISPRRTNSSPVIVNRKTANQTSSRSMFGRFNSEENESPAKYESPSQSSIPEFTKPHFNSFDGDDMYGTMESSHEFVPSKPSISSAPSKVDNNLASRRSGQLKSTNSQFSIDEDLHAVSKDEGSDTGSFVPSFLDPNRQGRRRRNLDGNKPVSASLDSGKPPEKKLDALDMMLGLGGTTVAAGPASAPKVVSDPFAKVESKFLSASTNSIPRTNFLSDSDDSSSDDNLRNRFTRKESFSIVNSKSVENNISNFSIFKTEDSSKQTTAASSSLSLSTNKTTEEPKIEKNQHHDEPKPEVQYKPFEKSQDTTSTNKVTPVLNENKFGKTLSKDNVHSSSLTSLPSLKTSSLENSASFSNKSPGIFTKAISRDFSDNEEEEEEVSMIEDNLDELDISGIVKPTNKDEVNLIHEKSKPIVPGKSKSPDLRKKESFRDLKDNNNNNNKPTLLTKSTEETKPSSLTPSPSGIKLSMKTVSHSRHGSSPSNSNNNLNSSLKEELKVSFQDTKSIFDLDSSRDKEKGEPEPILRRESSRKDVFSSQTTNKPPTQTETKPSSSNNIHEAQTIIDKLNLEKLQQEKHLLQEIDSLKQKINNSSNSNSSGAANPQPPSYPMHSFAYSSPFPPSPYPLTVEGGNPMAGYDINLYILRLQEENQRLKQENMDKQHTIHTLESLIKDLRNDQYQHQLLHQQQLSNIEKQHVIQLQQQENQWNEKKKEVEKHYEEQIQHILSTNATITPSLLPMTLGNLNNSNAENLPPLTPNNSTGNPSFQEHLLYTINSITQLNERYYQNIQNMIEKTSQNSNSTSNNLKNTNATSSNLSAINPMKEEFLLTLQKSIEKTEEMNLQDKMKLSNMLSVIENILTIVKNENYIEKQRLQNEMNHINQLFTELQSEKKYQQQKYTEEKTQFIQEKLQLQQEKDQWYQDKQQSYHQLQQMQMTIQEQALKQETSMKQQLQKLEQSELQLKHHEQLLQIKSEEIIQEFEYKQQEKTQLLQEIQELIQQKQLYLQEYQQISLEKEELQQVSQELKQFQQILRTKEEEFKSKEQQLHEREITLQQAYEDLNYHGSQLIQREEVVNQQLQLIQTKNQDLLMMENNIYQKKIQFLTTDSKSMYAMNPNFSQSQPNYPSNQMNAPSVPLTPYFNQRPPPSYATNILSTPQNIYNNNNHNISPVEKQVSSPIISFDQGPDLPESPNMSTEGPDSGVIFAPPPYHPPNPQPKFTSYKVEPRAKSDHPQSSSGNTNNNEHTMKPPIKETYPLPSTTITYPEKENHRPYSHNSWLHDLQTKLLISNNGLPNHMAKELRSAQRTMKDTHSHLHRISHTSLQTKQLLQKDELLIKTILENKS